MKLKFSGNRALITGGSSDIAIALAELMIDEGLHPLLTYRSDRGHEYIREGLENYSGHYGALYLNFGERESLGNMFLELDGGLDFMVDLAQGDLESLVASSSIEDVSHYFEENISFRSELLKRASRLMLKQRRGRLIFVSSTAAGKPNPGQGFYAASKLASEALYKNTGLELGSRGITAISLRPGYINSGRGKKYIDEHSDEISRLVPIQRALEAREVAEAILFFLSDSALGFNATEIVMDGGMSSGKI